MRFTLKYKKKPRGLIWYGLYLCFCCVHSLQIPNNLQIASHNRFLGMRTVSSVFSNPYQKFIFGNTRKVFRFDFNQPQMFRIDYYAILERSVINVC